MASLLCLPVVVCNLGSEMLYILEQRLRAQAITPDKSVKVLHDVVKSMFDPKFVEELFKPQEVYSQQSTRQIFDKLAHSSIMRLSESSMDKLYDLMTMGFKYQIISCRKPQDILTVTLTHLATVKSYLTDPDVQALVTATENMMQYHFGALTLGQWHNLRQALFRFLTEKQVKVSLFLQEGIQHSDGRIKLPSTMIAPGAVGAPGAIKLSGAVQDTEALQFGLKSSPAHPVPPGGNLYAKDRSTAAAVPASPTASSGGSAPPTPTSAAAPAPAAAPPVPVPTKGNAEKLLENADKQASKELNSLADLIRPATAAPTNNFKLNLFNDTSDSSASNGGSGGSSEDVIQINRMIEFDAKEGNKASGLEGIMGDFSLKDDGGQGGEHDLLDLMDSADK